MHHVFVPNRDDGDAQKRLNDFPNGERKWNAVPPRWASRSSLRRVRNAFPAASRSSGDNRVLRGGSYWNDARNCHSANRNKNDNLVKSLIVPENNLVKDLHLIKKQP